MIDGKNIRLRYVEIDDAGYILSLRMDERLNTYMSKVNGNLDLQIEWIRDYKDRERKKEEYYFIIEDKKSTSVGTVRMYDFVDKSFSWGSWMVTDSAPRYTAIESALLIYELAFFKLGFVGSHFEVRKGNERVRDFHLRFGAVQTGEDDINYYFNISKNDYEKTRPKYEKFLA